MGLVYVYGPNDNENDYSTMGLCGPLDATSCKFVEEANGESSIELEHPLDMLGKFEYLENGNILKVRIPVRRPPAIQNGSDQLLTRVWKYKLKSKAEIGRRKALYTLYKKRTGTGGTTLNFDTAVISLSYIPEETNDKEKRYEVITEDGGKGWMLMEGLDPIDGPEGTVLVGNSSASIEAVLSPWAVSDGYFRIYETQKTLDGITVKARHITYDLMYNVTHYHAEKEVTVQDDISGILNDCLAEHSFEAYTDVQNKREGISYRGKNPANAFLDENEGVCARFGVDLVRINHDLYFLHDPGVNRGVRIEYSRNMTGVDFTYSTDQIMTRFIPTGKNKDGTVFYLNSSSRASNSKKPISSGLLYVYEDRAGNKVLRLNGHEGFKKAETDPIGTIIAIENYPDMSIKTYRIGPEFELGKYYKEDSHGLMQLLTEKPSDWDKNYTKYRVGVQAPDALFYDPVRAFVTEILPYIDSPRINEYPFPYVYEFPVDNCEIGNKGSDGITVTAAIAELRMRKAVEDLIKDGTIDQPTVEMKVEFQNLGDTEEYKNSNFKDLETCYLYDYVNVIYKKLNINQTLQIIKMEWDCLTERMESMDMGTPGKYIEGVNVGNKVDIGVASGRREKEKSATLGGVTYVSQTLPDITPDTDPNTIVFDPVNMTMSTPNIALGVWEQKCLSGGPGLSSKGVMTYVGNPTSEFSPVGFTVETSALNSGVTLAGDSPNDGDILYDDTAGNKQYRYENGGWQSQELTQMDFQMSEDSAVAISPEEGIRVEQDSGTYFQANNQQFGLYKRVPNSTSSVPIAEGGVDDDGTGYFSSNRIKDPTVDTGHVDIKAEASDGRLGYSMDFKTLDYSETPYDPELDPPDPELKSTVLKISVSNEPAWAGGETYENNTSASITVENDGILNIGRTRIKSAEAPISPETTGMALGEAWGFSTGFSFGCLLPSADWVLSQGKYQLKYYFAGTFFDEYDPPIFVCPQPESMDDWTTNGVKAVSTGNETHPEWETETGYMLFEAATAPSNDIRVNVLIFGGITVNNDWEE